MGASAAPYSSKTFVKNASRLHTIDGSRPHRQHINRWRVWRAFNGQGGGRVGGRTNGVKRVYLQRRCALPPMFDAWTAGTAALCSLARPGNAYLLSGLLHARRTKNGNCNAPGGSSRCWSDTVNMKGTASANSFAAPLLLFSEKQRARRTVNATHHERS